MSQKDFVLKVQKHLENYKQNHLGIEEKGIYNYRGKDYYFGYIIPKNISNYNSFNIIETYRKDFDDYLLSLKKTIRLHRYFNHLNSSQALAINFFFPLIQEKKLEAILDILGIQNDDIDYSQSCFEKESDIETGTFRKTNFDFYIELKSGVKIYFEIKYTENEFGKAKHNTEYKNKFNSMYKELLKKCSAIKADFKTEKYFLSNYQLMRNLIHINENSYVVFLFPKNNINIRRKSEWAKNEVVYEKFNHHFMPITWEDLVEKACEKFANQNLFDYYNEDFRKKYFY